MVNHLDRIVGFRFRFEAIDEHIQNPFTDTRKGFDPGRVKNLGGEITAEDAPRGTVEGGANVMLITVHDLSGGEGVGAVREDDAVLNKSVVGKRSIGYKYGRTRANS